MADEEKRKKGRLKRAVAKVAPQLAHALGGPLAGAAVSTISRTLFGKDLVDEEEIAAAIATAVRINCLH